MLFRKNYKTAAATFVVAITTGFVMQNGDALASRFATAAPQAMPDQTQRPKTAEIRTAEADITPVAATVTNGESILADRINSTGQSYTAPKIATDQEYSALGLACDVTLDATQSVGAMVTLDFKAPCHVNETVTVTHEGLAFTAVTSEIGHFTAQVPALAGRAKFDVDLIDGGTVSATTDVLGVSNYDRVALQWTGDSGLRIHALEMGAEYGERGHVWANAPQTIATALQSRGGYLTALGSMTGPGAKHIEIYSFPTGQAQKSGVVRLSVEAEVTANTCNKEIAAQALQSGVDGKISIVDLTLSMPACDAIGDFLVLNNLLRDLKIAQNKYEVSLLR